MTSLYARDTIEERIQRLLNQKRAHFNSVFDELTDANLEKLLTEEEVFGLFGIQRRKSSQPSYQKDQATSKIADFNFISPQNFETSISELYERMGFVVSKTQATRDGGVDVYATRYSDSGTEQLMIQCKHYPDRKVSVDAVRSLYGLMQSDPKITRGVLVTSGDFTADSVHLHQERE